MLILSKSGIVRIEIIGRIEFVLTLLSLSVTCPDYCSRLYRKQIEFSKQEMS